jgi:hypothetical protein
VLGHPQPNGVSNGTIKLPMPRCIRNWRASRTRVSASVEMTEHDWVWKLHGSLQILVNMRAVAFLWECRRKHRVTYWSMRAWKPESLAPRWYVCAAERESARRTRSKHRANSCCSGATTSVLTWPPQRSGESIEQTTPQHAYLPHIMRTREQSAAVWDVNQQVNKTTPLTASLSQCI